MGIKRWKINTISKEKSRILSEEYGLSELVADLLVGRGLDAPYDAESFLTDDASYSDPFALVDMDRAAQRILEAVESGEKIAVYGDYDCDGVTASAILYRYLESIGAEVTCYLPEREGEGYGLNKGALELLKDEGVGLIVTVDNGISAAEEVAYAYRLGMEVVITDHHQPGDVLPEAAAVVNPHRRDCESECRCLCGAGVALKLVAALEGGSMDTAVEFFGDIAAIGTIGDIVPLTGENRKLVREGLRLIQNTENLGLLALLEAAGLSGKTLTAENIAFGIVPRINAAGRMGSARLALDLLLCEEEDRAAELAQAVCSLNQERQQQESKIMSDIERVLAAHPEKLHERVLVLAGEGWHHGVVGIVSARMLERFSKPNILISIDGEEARGSARSCGEFSLFAALSACGSYLTKFGGHKQAAGLSMKADQIDAFAKAINCYAKEVCQEMPQVVCQVDREIRADELTVENIKSLDLLEPFGAENQTPVFLMRGLRISGMTPLSGNKHLKLALAQPDGVQVQALCFGVGTDRFPYGIGETVDIVVSVGINQYNGRKSVSVKLKDIRPAGFEEEKFFSAKAVYEAFLRGEEIDPRLKERILPKREEVAAVYRLLVKNGGFSNELDLLYLKFSGTKLNYCKFRIILDVLDELKLIKISPLEDAITLPEQVKKVNLEQSEILHRLEQI